MTTVNIPIETDDIINSIELGHIVDAIADDILKQNPQWWSEQICKPLLTELKKVFKQPCSEIVKECVKEVLVDVIDCEQMEQIVKDTIVDIVETDVRVKVNRLLKAI